jgi:L-lactate utilization protein LutB
MVDDIKQGRKDKVKVEELREAVEKKDDEYRQAKMKLALEMDNTSSLRDSLEMKNSLIMNLHGQKKQLKTRMTVWQVVAVVATILFAVK